MNKPINDAITLLNELSTVIKQEWTRDGTTITQDNRFFHAAKLIEEASMLLQENCKEFERESYLPQSAKNHGWEDLGPIDK